jgi:hypothetical protein
MNYNNEFVDQYDYTEKDGKARSKYDQFHTGKDLGTWEGLDQDQRAWWRSLGLGVDRSTCNGANTKVTTDNKCISGKADCTRVNYHTAKRWRTTQTTTRWRSNGSTRATLASSSARTSVQIRHSTQRATLRGLSSPLPKYHP